MGTLEKLVTLTYNTSDLSTTVQPNYSDQNYTIFLIIPLKFNHQKIRIDAVAEGYIAIQYQITKKIKIFNIISDIIDNHSLHTFIKIEQAKAGTDKNSIGLEFTRLSGDETSFRAQGRKVFDILKENPYLNQKFTDFEYIAAGGFGLVFKAKKKINKNKPQKIYEEKQMKNEIAFKFMLNDENAKREILIMKKLFTVSSKMLMARNIQVFRRYEISSKQNGQIENGCRLINSENNLIVNSPPQLHSSLSEGMKDRVPYVMIEMSKAAFSVDSAIQYRKRNKKPYFMYEITKIISDVLQSLFLMHIQGIVHLDVKPQNILYVDELSKYILSDFGCSLELNSIDFENYQLSTDEIIGFTPQYTDPNILDKPFFNPFKADIWSVGVILLELLSVGQDFDLVQILKECKNSEDITKKIFNQFIYNCNGQMIYCPLMKNFIEIDNQLKMYLQWDEAQRWNIIEILIESQNNALIQPFYIPFNYQILNKKLFSFLAEEDHSTPSSKIPAHEIDLGNQTKSYSQTECPYLYRQHQYQMKNIFLSDGDLIQGWKYRGFVHANHNLQQSGLYSNQKSLSKDGKGTLTNQENQLVFQGTFDRDLPTGTGTFILSNFCERKASFTGISSIDQAFQHTSCDKSMNDIEKIVYEGEFDNGQMCGGKITYIHEKKGASYLLNRSFRNKQTFLCPQGKIVSCKDLNSKYISINLKCYRQSLYDKIFYVSSKTYLFQNYKSLIYEQKNTINEIMQKIKTRIIDTDTKFMQRLQTAGGYNFYFEQSILVYSYFVSVFEFYDKFIKLTIIQDISSQYALYDMFLLFEAQVSEQIAKTMNSMKNIKTKGKLAHDKFCNYDFYKQYKGMLCNLESFCDNRDTELINFKEFGLNKSIKNFDLNCTSHLTEEECQYISNREVGNDQSVYEFLELKNMKRIGMYFATNNYLEKYLSKSLNTLEYLNISFHSPDVLSDFTSMRDLKVLRKLKIHEACPSQMQGIFQNLNTKCLKTLHLGRWCEYNDEVINILSRINLSTLKNFKLVNYDSNKGKWIEALLKNINTLSNLTKICIKSYVSQECCTQISQKLRNLEILKLSYCQMNNDLVSALKNMDKVVTFYANSNIITDDGTKYIYQNIPNIKKIKLNNSQNLSFRGLFLLSSNLKKLEVIEFKNILSHINYYQFSTEKDNKCILYEKEKSSGISFIDSLYELKNLQSFRFAQQYEDCFLGENHYSRARPMTPEFIKSLAVLKLTEIDLSDIKEDYLKHFISAKGVSNAIRLILNPKVNQISDDVAMAIISGTFNQLQYLSLSSCYNLSSKTIQILLSNKSIQKTIKELYLNNTEFDDTCAEYLVNFIRLFPNLNIISIKNCIEISEQTLQKLNKFMQQNKITLIY